MRAGRPHRRRDADGGLSVIEVIVALAIIGTVMTAMLPFLVSSVISVRQQSSEQTAIAIVNDALERARALKPTSLLVGRGEESTKRQWADAPVQAVAYLATMKQDWDPTAQPVDAVVPLPTEAHEVTVHGTTYSQNWYVGRCWQPRVDPAQTVFAVGDCVAAPVRSTDVPFFQVVVAVTWRVASPVSQGSCIAGLCAYLAVTLLSPGPDPIFDIKRPPPTIITPGNQLGYVGEPVSLLLAATGGWLPRTWTATGLPAGLTMAAGTGTITGTPTTARAASAVTILVTDRDKKTDDVTFTWAIAELPVLTSPGDQTSRINTAVSLPVPLTGGHSPRSWSATGLPTGLSINTATGVITGTPTTEAQTIQPVKVTVVDAGKKTVTVTFGWRVLTPVQVPVVPTQNFASGSNAGNFTVRASGGLPPYTWQATGLPDGFSMSSGGVVTGTATNGTRFIVTAVATDSAGGTATLVVVCNVSSQSNELRITTPLNDRTDKVGTTITGTADGSPGGAGSRSWSATGLPTGVTFSTAGVLGGSPTTAGRYITTLTAVATNGKIARTMLIWTVTP
jgi:type II secretory pathway pseudopilin PulG